MFLFKLIVLLLAWGLGFAILSGATTDLKNYRSALILHHLDNVQVETRQLNMLLNDWDGSLFGMLNISDQTDKVWKTTRSASLDIKEHSHRLGIAGALHVRRATLRLKSDIKASVAVIANRREEFHKLGVAYSVLHTLYDQQNASSVLNAAIVPKLPRIGRGQGRRVGRKISNVFQAGIDLYKRMLKEETLDEVGSR